MESNAGMSSIRLVAVLEIGSTGIRLLIAEITGKGEWRAVDSAVKPVVFDRGVLPLGKSPIRRYWNVLLFCGIFRNCLRGGASPATMYTL
jgi:exopolyphosphatase/guanosine-5'-triphosphate,3'-diphosphate pyrophosphatase